MPKVEPSVISHGVFVPKSDLDRANAEIERHERVQAKLVKMFLDYSNHADAEMRDNGLTLNPDGTVTEIGHG